MSQVSRIGQFDLQIAKCQSRLHGPEDYEARAAEPCALIGTIPVCHECVREYLLDWDEALMDLGLRGTSPFDVH